MKKPYLFALLFFAGLLFCQTASAQDFVYRPKNPAFGGDTFNYNWLLSSAQSQDLTEDTRSDRQFGSNADLELSDFTESLNRQLLNQLSRQIAVTQFGEDGLEDGSYTVGDFQIDVATTLEGLAITIVDASVGEQTQIIIPFF
ncbi:MAG: curli production assembly/transport component CsgF [Bacteroidota bacterium]